MGSGW
jgi:RNA ligase